MTKTLEQFLTALKSLRLKQAKRDAMRTSIFEYMQRHPLQKKAQNETTLFSFFPFFVRRHAFATLTILLTIIIGNGITYAADQTLPGDPFYVIKITLNEEVRALFLSKEEKAKWEVERATRRLEEAITLILEGRLTQDEAAQIQEQFQTHTNRVAKATQELGEEGNQELAADINALLTTSLKAQKQIFAQLGEEYIKAREAIHLFGDLQMAEEAAKKAQTRAILTLTTEQGEKLEPLILEKSASVKKLRQALITKTSPSVLQKNSYELATLDELIGEAKKRMEKRELSQAYILFQEAEAVARQLEFLIKTMEEQQKKTPLPKPSPPSPSPLPIVNNAPKIIEYPTQTGTVIAQNSISLNWEAFDSDGGVLAWQIAWGTGGSEINASGCKNTACTHYSATHTWTMPGVYLIEVSVTDPQGAADSYTFPITVK